MNKPRFLFAIFKMFFFFLANVCGSELESHHVCVEVLVFMFYACSC